MSDSWYALREYGLLSRGKNVTKVRSILKWAFALIAAILVGYELGQVFCHERYYTVTYLIPNLAEALVLTFIIRPRRGWLLGASFELADGVFSTLCIVIMGSPTFGSFQLALYDWWTSIGVSDLLYSLIAILAGALGGHLGVLLRNRLARRQQLDRAENRPAD